MINVLIVDDDRFARMGLISMIPWEKYGMKVIGEAANGRRALDFMRQTQVNLMFVDIAMPVMDGMELLRQVKAEFKGVHFVVLTFHEDFEYVQEALRLGALDYISKEKMELENYDDVMNRIRCAIVSDENYKGMTDNDQLRPISEALDGVLWLYDNYQMELVLQQLRAQCLPMRALEKLFAATMARITAETQVVFPYVSHLESTELVVQYLSACRDHFHEQVMLQSSSIYGRLMIAAEYICKNSGQSIQATDVANAVNYSRSYFSVTFKKVLGVTFNEFLRRERVRNARVLLRTTAMPQSEIAQCCGYGDVSNFKNAFREVVGCSPGKYRAACSAESG